MKAESRERAGPPPDLLELLRRRIAETGPLDVAAFMETCLTDPTYGYYQHRDPFGLGGDFTTAPEISQIFGELLGLWYADVWERMGRLEPLHLVELGPGRGTLMADALRAVRVVPGCSDALRVHLVETSPRLRSLQRDALARSGQAPRWHRTIDSVPGGAAVIVANEFLDALPVRQFQRRSGAWYERCIGLGRNGALAFRLAEEPLEDESLLPPALREDAADGMIAEVRPAAGVLLTSLARRAAPGPLMALFIDYGHVRSGFGETLQAVRSHRPVDPLSHVGDADLTAHVDFEALARLAGGHGLDVWGPMDQADFLQALGLRQRRDRLLAAAGADRRERVAAGAERLVADDQMGRLFKVMAIGSRGSARPAPFGPPAEIGRSR